MQEFSRLATAAAAITFMSLPATVARAQNAPPTETKRTTAPATAPAATTAAPADAKPAATTEQAAELKKEKPRPARYRKSASKEYLNFVPFDKIW